MTRKENQTATHRVPSEIYLGTGYYTSRHTGPMKILVSKKKTLSETNLNFTKKCVFKRRQNHFFGLKKFFWDRQFLRIQVFQIFSRNDWNFGKISTNFTGA